MNQIINMKQFLIYCKIIFHFLNVLLIVFYLFPGSILGWFLYNDLNKQPRITADFTSNFINVSSNHFFIFFIFSLFGILSYLKVTYNLRRAPKYSILKAQFETVNQKVKKLPKKIRIDNAECNLIIIEGGD